MEIIKFKVVHIMIVLAITSFVPSKGNFGKMFELFGNTVKTMNSVNPLEYFDNNLNRIKSNNPFFKQSLTLNIEHFFEYFDNSLNTIVKVPFSKDLSTLEDAFLPIDEIISNHGYPVENHYVTTEDGYILTIQRIPNPGKKPFLLQHGLFCSSAVFVINETAKISPAYYLWENGYDVWLGNIRGNTYGRNHTTLNPNKKKFWDYSFHEMGVYDLPAMIDYILSISDYSKIIYAGHSQGTTMFFIMCSKRPEYNEKIEVMHALAPIAFLNHLYSLTRPILELLLHSPLPNFIYEFLPSIQTYRRLCSTGQETQLPCLNPMFMKTGHYLKKFHLTNPLRIFGHIPAGVSIKTLQHFHQLINSPRFSEFDYGRDGNLAHYGQEWPPSYNISKITARIAIFNSHWDTFSVPVDVNKLVHKLGNNVIAKITIRKLWTHTDFLWATDIKEVIFDKMLTINSMIERGCYCEN